MIPATLISWYLHYLLTLNLLLQYYEAGAKAMQNRIKNDDNINKAWAFANALKANGMNGVEITAMLNEHGYKTSRGCQYYHQTTMRLLK
jgi:hypothetical protein